MTHAISLDLSTLLDELLGAHPGKATSHIDADASGYPTVVLVPVNRLAPPIFLYEFEGYYYIQPFERADPQRAIAAFDPSDEWLDIRTDVRAWALAMLSDIATHGMAEIRRYRLGFIPRASVAVVLNAPDALDRLRHQKHLRVLKVWEPW